MAHEAIFLQVTATQQNPQEEK